MEDIKQKAINEVSEEMKRDAYISFKADVRHQIERINELSRQLVKAKETLANMEYVEPTIEA